MRTKPRLDSVRQAGRRMCLRHSANSGSPRRSISESVWRRAFANSTSAWRILIRWWDSLRRHVRPSSNGDKTCTRCLRNDGGRCLAAHNNCNREDAMATKAYILIKVKAGRTKDVLQALKRLAGVEQAHSCFGRPDIILFINVTDERALSDVVITKIHQVEGVEETDTHIVADA
ncbi:MAG: Lrp/AsnC family transcriptional regulator [Nitrospirae bacterium]|nr:MAG: Lrp/AsnC family transcriptional regulator [Nitrospirota bacterium]